MNFLIYVLGVCGSGPHRPRGVGYTWSVVRRGRAPLRSRPRQRVTVAGQQRVAAGDWPAGRLESVCAWAAGGRRAVTSRENAVQLADRTV